MKHALNISVVVANREYEAWFLAAVGSLAGMSNLPDSLVAPEDPEDIRGAKEWISKKMGVSHKYSPARHQVAFSAAIALEDARACRSFRKFEKEILRFLTRIQSA